MKKRLLIHTLLSVVFFLSAGQMTKAAPNADGPGGGNHGDVPPQVVDPGGNKPVIPAGVVHFSSYLDGEVFFYGNMVEIDFNQLLSVSAVTLTNMSDGRSNCTYFNDVMTDQVIVPSLSSNGLWDICVASGNTDYHTAIFVDCYQSVYTSSEN